MHVANASNSTMIPRDANIFRLDNSFLLFRFVLAAGFFFGIEGFAFIMLMIADGKFWRKYIVISLVLTPLKLYNLHKSDEELLNAYRRRTRW
jgi:hypothetical protein